jgi:16S rRNA G966 N2-methylase RsmD
VGIEALSRGAARVEFVERAPAALSVLKSNLAKLGVTAGFQVHNRSVGGLLRLLKAGKGLDILFDIVFLDPPYDAGREYADTLGALGGDSVGVLASGAVVIAEHRRKEKLEDRYGELARTRLLEQGDAALSFYAAATVSPAN